MSKYDNQTSLIALFSKPFNKPYANTLIRVNMFVQNPKTFIAYVSTPCYFLYIFLFECKYLAFLLSFHVTLIQEIPWPTPSYARNSKFVISVSTEQQSFATAMASSSIQSASSSSWLSSTSLSSLLTSSLSSSTTTTVKTATAKLLKTSATSTVNLRNGFTTPSTSEKIHTCLSVKTRTSLIVYSIEPSSPSPAIESSMDSNPSEKRLHEAIEKVHCC